MKVLFDQNMPRPLIRYLSHHEVVRAAEMGWDELRNGVLLTAAEEHGFEVMVTADRNIAYQQNLSGRRLALIVLPYGRWPKVKPFIADVVRAVDQARPGSYTDLRQPGASAPRSG